MKRLIPLVLLSLVGCGGTETIRSSLTISDKPPRVAGIESALQVPDFCPVYAPSGGDVDTVESPFPDGANSLCAVDDAGNAYGIIEGDAPGVQLAILPGNREIGVFVGFAPGSFSSQKVALITSPPNLEAWVAPTNVESPQGCCPEQDPNAQVAIQTVALGEQGILFSLGSFDSKPTQAVFDFDTSPNDNTSYAGRFYVNGAP
jgi:hypothetical protein